MVAIQIISKILTTSDNSIIDDNLLDVSYFVGYEDEFNFIENHIKQYGNVPDKATFLSKFPDFELVEVAETDRYLIDTIREESLYHRSAGVLQKFAEMLQTDSNAANEYLNSQMGFLQPTYTVKATDIIAEANTRYDEYIERKQHQDEWFFTTGFPELDDIIQGIQRTEELVVLFARTNQGKSWVLEKICTHIWQIGYNVGYISPEMTASSIGYRFDTLVKSFSNKGLMRGNNDISEESYKQYIDSLNDHKNKFLVATPVDFDRKITVTKLRNFIKTYKLDILAIDGITYITDERGRRGDNKTTSLTNISEDLMSLSIEVGIPVMVVVQAGRGAVQDNSANDLPELEHIRDSDGIAYNASKVISIKQNKDGILQLGIKKQRFGAVGGKLTYKWDIDTGGFVFIPSYDDAQPREKTERRVREVKKQFNDKEDVF